MCTSWSRHNRLDDVPALYTIRVGAVLSPEWSDWFEGLTITTHPDGTTELRGLVHDQAMLFGLLMRIRDLGLSLLSVQRHDRKRNESHPPDGNGLSR